MTGKNKGKGGRNFKKVASKNITQVRDLAVKEPGQEYAQVNKLLGCCRLDLYCFDGENRLGLIRGKIKKRQWIKVGDIVLIGIRDYQDKKCDVILRYTPSETKQLIAAGQIPEVQIVEDCHGLTTTTMPSNDNLVFDSDVEESERYEPDSIPEQRNIPSYDDSDIDSDVSI